MLSKPVLARCDNRAQVAKKNNVYGEPDQWLTTEGLAPVGLAAISFDFFIDWSKAPPIVENELWVKRISPVSVEDIGPAHLLDGALGCGDDLASLEQFATRYGFTARYVVFRDGVNWRREPESILVSALREGQFPRRSLLSLGQIEEAVRHFSGGAIRIGGKGLTYGTSTLECHLASSTDALWPGDADCVLWDPNESRAVAILEFKKHNLDTPLADENIRQYMSKDLKKWQRLALLRDRLGAPLYCVYYSTNPAVDRIKVERLEGPPDNLVDAGSTMIAISGMRPSDIGQAIVAAL